MFTISFTHISVLRVISIRNILLSKLTWTELYFLYVRDFFSPVSFENHSSTMDHQLSYRTWWRKQTAPVTWLSDCSFHEVLSAGVICLVADNRWSYLLTRYPSTPWTSVLQLNRITRLLRNSDSSIQKKNIRFWQHLPFH